ncbi:hypothetical protein ER57_12120 [Smithella sp. SCADC]|nr:hypothetical protein ER57_12120 [Smithella sp. SCADC]HAR49193.1 hypothetical protein [Smithella sp.]
MNARSLASGLSYCGEVSAVRQTYYVFEGKKHYFVLTFSRTKPNAGNFNIVDVNAANYIAKIFAGKKAITSNDVLKNCKKPQYVSDSLKALNVLYSLVATNRAVIDTRFKGKQLKFNIK